MLPEILTYRLHDQREVPGHQWRDLQPESHHGEGNGSAAFGRHSCNFLTLETACTMAQRERAPLRVARPPAFYFPE